MTDAQTEARAIALVLEYYIAGAQDGLSKVPVGALSRIATALAAKDAELAAVKAERDALRNEAAELVVVQYEVSALKADRDNLAECNALIGQDLREALDRAERAEAQLAEARKALEPFALATILPTGEVIGMDRQWFDAARRALEAQGGENG